MKRRISLLLAVVMILGSFSFAFAANDEVKPAEFLEKQGVLKGNAKGDLMLDEALLRRDAVVLLSRLMNAEEEAKGFKKEGFPTFKDITDNHYVGYLAWAQSNEYIKGHDDKGERFGFNDNLTTREYSTVLLRALGYVEEAKDWDKVFETAKKLGLLEKVEKEADAEITRADMAQMTFNALGTKMKGSDKTLAEFLGIEMPAPDVLEAKVLDTENLAEIVVELSNAKLVKNKEALTNPANYRLSDSDVKVYNVELDGNNVILTLVPYGRVDEQGNYKTLIKGKRYNLTIRNIDPKINKTYTGILAEDNAIPVVENVDFMGTHGIKVTTSEPIANPLERNFRLDSRTSMIVEQYGREIILTPYHGKAFDKDAVELKIDKLQDFARYTSVSSVQKMALSTDEALPKVEAAYRSGNKLVVVFDKDVYLDSIGHYENRRDLGNVSFVERRVTFYAEDSKKLDTNVVEYTFGRDIPKNIEIEIEGVANHFNKAMDKQTIVPVEYKDDYAPVVISSTAKVKITKDEETTLKGMTDEVRKDKINKGHFVKTQNMTIVFDKDIEEFKSLKASDINVKDHFTLYELDITRRGEAEAKEVKINVKEVKKDRITLTFENIKLNNKDRDYDYILEVRNFTDTNRNRMERDYLDFQVVRISDAFDVEVKDIRNNGYFNRDGVEIVLEFNDYVNKEEASNERNYYLDGKLDVDEAIVERDGTTVSLVVYDTNKNELLKDYKVLEISPRVTDLSVPSNVPEHRFFDLATKKAIDGPKASDAAITYINRGSAADDTSLPTGTKLDASKVLTVPVDAGKNQYVTVEYKAEVGKQVEVRLLDKDGKTKDLQYKTVADADVAETITVAVPLTASATYTIEVKADGEVSKLTVKVVETAATGTLYLKSDDTKKAVLGTDNDIIFPYGFDLSTLKAEDFAVKDLSTGAELVQLIRPVGADKLTVAIKAENGDIESYDVALKNATVASLAVKTAPTKVTYNNGDKLDLTGLVVTITDSIGKAIDVALADFADYGITTTPVNGATLTTTGSVTVQIDLGSVNTTLTVTVN